MELSEIQTAQGDVVNTSKNLGAEAVMFFEEQFKEETCQEGDAMLEVISKLISVAIMKN